MYTQNLNNHEKPKVITYPNQQAIIDMTRKNSESIRANCKNDYSIRNNNTEQAENLIILILTLLLYPDVDFSGIEYLITAFTLIW